MPYRRDIMFDITQLGEKIRLLRKSMKLTQSELAEKLHVSFQAISSWECGGTYPDIENLCRLAQTFDVSVDKLLTKQESDAERFMIGVDGGGTKSEFALFTSSGRVIKTFKLPGTNASTIGVAEAVKILCKGIELCLEAQPEISAVFIGNAGNKLQDIKSILAEKYPSINFAIDSDAVNAFCCAEGDAALICGTGSIMLRREGDGFRTIGGWGYMLGDPGSGFNFGREALRLGAGYEDGIHSDPMFYSLIKEKTGCDSVIRLDRKVPASIATLASVIFDAMAAGDELAEQVIHNEMKQLAAIVSATLPDGGRVVAVGGMMEHYRDALMPVLRQYVDERIEFVFPKLPPIYGACVACCERFLVARAKDFEQSFAEDYRRLNV